MGDTRNKAEDLKGRAKEAAGALKDDDRLKAEGKADRASAGLKDTIDEVADRAEDAVDRVKERIQKR